MILDCARPTDDGFQAWLQDLVYKSGVFSCASADGGPDRAALVALYHATDGPNWDNNRNWLSDRPPGAWHGVTTDGDGRVTELLLGYNQLSGSIPAELGSLSNLKWLLLGDNQLSGSIPAELGSLAKLEWLDLGVNQLSGLIPAELGSLSSLQSLHLGGNELSGSIPAELGSLAKLEWLNLDGNSALSGPLPGSLTGLTSLRDLTLDDTGLCAPTDDGFQAWLQDLEYKSGVFSCAPADGGA